MNLTKKKIVVISTRPHNNWRNRNAYQKLAFLRTKYEVYYIGQWPVCDELRVGLSQHLVMPRFLPFAQVTFFMWALVSTYLAIRKFDVHLVYTPWGPHELIVGSIFKKMGYPWVADIWDDPEMTVLHASDYNGFSTKCRQIWYSLLILVVKGRLHKADLILAFIRSQVIQRKYAVPSSQIIQFTNGVDLTLEYLSPSHHDNNNKYDLIKREKAFKLAFVGFLVRSHIETLIEATAIAASAIPNFQLLLIGPHGKNADQVWLVQTLSKYKLDTVVHMAGQLPHDETVKLLSGASVCVCPYPELHDMNARFPVKILEYMALGKPVIATKLWGTEQLIRHDVDGMLVEPGSVEELAKAILCLAQNQVLRRKLASRARKRVKSYDWNAIMLDVGKALEMVHVRKA